VRSFFWDGLIDNILTSMLEISKIISRSKPFQICNYPLVFPSKFPILHFAIRHFASLALPPKFGALESVQGSMKEDAERVQVVRERKRVESKVIKITK